MRRLLPAAIAAAVLVAAFAGVASARFVDSGESGPELAPFDAPAAVPAADPGNPGAYGFRSGDRIAERYERGSATAGRPGTSGGSSASVTVTAVVLPVVYVIVDESGDVTRIATNTPERDARGVLYLVRAGSETGPSRALDAATWADARDALAGATAGTGTIWSA